MCAFRAVEAVCACWDGQMDLDTGGYRWGPFLPLGVCCGCRRAMLPFRDLLAVQIHLLREKPPSALRMTTP